jgi:hypothetical protein
VKQGLQWIVTLSIAKLLSCVFVSVRKDPPVVKLTDKVRAALGDKIDHLWSMTMIPSYSQRITDIMSALDLLVFHSQLLPEERAEFQLNRGHDHAMIVQLEDMCWDTTIPEPNRKFISLVVSSFNMHVFDIPNVIKMRMEDVFEYV